MQDHDIIELYWKRNERAIIETANKYGRYCFSISYNILHDQEDAKECLNDTYLGRPIEVTEDQVYKAVSEMGSLKLFLDHGTDVFFMATLILEEGRNTDVWEVVRLLSD